MAKKKYADKDHSHNLPEICIVILGVLVSALFIAMINAENNIKDLQEEIASMPHYESYEESFKGFINISETDSFCWSLEGMDYCHSKYDGYSATCDLDSHICFVDDTKEVVKLFAI